MPEVSWELNLKVGGETKIVPSGSLTAEAYAEIEVTVNKGAKEELIEVQPAAAEQIKFVLITAGNYQDDKLFYTLKKDTSAKKITLDAPQFFIGAGMIGLLEPAPKEIYVTNNLGQDVKLNILVGRDATPPGSTTPPAPPAPPAPPTP